MAAKDPQASSYLSAPFERAWGEVERVAPAVGNHPRAVLLTASLAGIAGTYYYAR